MPNVAVQYDVRHYTIEEGDPSDEPYSWRGVEGRDNTIYGVRQVGDGEYGELSTSFDIDPNAVYYLLYAVYSTGSSFSRTEGEIEFVGLYRDPEVARDNADRCWKSRDGDSFNVKLVTEDGEEYQLHTPWQGYFESLTDVRVETVGAAYHYSARGY